MSNTGKDARADFLVEIGTEELPPAALQPLMHAFAESLDAALAEARLVHDGVAAFASPRRLAVKVAALASAQPERQVEHRGPPISVAFDAEGQPTRAAQAFAAKNGVTVDDLQRKRTEKGEWLVHRATETGLAAAEILPGCVESALALLPVPRRMRWGNHDSEFVRPVHWIVMLHGPDIVRGRMYGRDAGRVTHGHRFMGADHIELANPADYPRLLEERGHVVADFGERRRRIVAQVTAAARAAGGEALGGDALFDEVTALTEWPVALTGSFDERFLALPRPVIVATLTSHQRYFPVAREDGTLLPAFVTVANLDSTEPEKVRNGNERVIRPRLADAAFFWESDRRTSLADRQSGLANVVYQRGLGTLEDKSRRVAALARDIAGAIGADAGAAERAAALAKCDLLTGMVGEFPELQGTMGRHYALADDEPPSVADAIGEQYLPRFAGDSLPQTPVGRALAIADKLDTLCGVFALGRKPSGNRDPFGLRRSALGVARILLDGRLDANLGTLLRQAMAGQPAEANADRDPVAVRDFIIDRLRAWYLERSAVTAEMFEAVRAREPESLVDLDARLSAVAQFVDHDAAESLAAANKRIANILRQAGFGADDSAAAPASGLHVEDAERALGEALEAARAAVARPLAAREYAIVLERLAELRQPVDRFFDEVMVMAEDDEVRQQRLTLLAGVRAEFLNVADISSLSIAKA